MRFFHILCGSMLLLGIMVAATIWLVMMVVACNNDSLDETVRSKVCQAIHPDIIDATTGNNADLLFDSIP